MRMILKKTLLLLSVFTIVSAQKPDFSMVGFATMNGGTTGGQGGQVVTATNFAELQKYCMSTEPYIIKITGEIKGSNGATVERVIRMKSNKTLVGIGSGAFINQISIYINSQKNIIIRNIKFTMKDVPVDVSGAEVKIQGTNSDPDMISICADNDTIPEADRITRNIWIDHCEFYNEDPAVMTDVNRYDGMVDQKNDCQYVTISWCYFHDHHKGCLSGKGNSDDFDRKMTMHHNYYKNIISRTPLLRFGKLHAFNNYMEKCDNGVNVRVMSQAVLEKNYFKDCKKPIFGKPDDGGSGKGGTAQEIGNYYDNCDRLSSKNIPCTSSPNASALSSGEEYSTNSYAVPYEYSKFVNDVASVPTIVPEWAGVGKVDDITAISPANAKISTTGVTIAQHGRIMSVLSKTNSNLTVSTASGRVVYSERLAANMAASISSLQPGFYIVKVGNYLAKVVIPFQSNN